MNTFKIITWHGYCSAIFRAMEYNPRHSTEISGDKYLSRQLTNRARFSQSTWRKSKILERIIIYTWNWPKSMLWGIHQKRVRKIYWISTIRKCGKKMCLFKYLCASVCWSMQRKCQELNWKSCLYVAMMKKEWMILRSSMTFIVCTSISCTKMAKWKRTIHNYVWIQMYVNMNDTICDCPTSTQF